MSESEVVACSGKLVFDTKVQAKAAALVADWQHATKLHAYHCRHCGLWHLSGTKS